MPANIMSKSLSPRTETSKSEGCSESAPSLSSATGSQNTEDTSDNNTSSSSDGISAYISAASGSSQVEVKVAEFASLKNAIKLINLEAIKAEEVYKAENQLLSKANEQLMKFSRLLQEQDAELAATEEALNKERKQRESAEKHFIKLKKMMVVKDVEVSEAEQRKKSEINLRKGAEKEMTLLRRQLQSKESALTSAERKYQKECKRREKLESQMVELSKKAGRQSAEEKYQMLQRLRERDDHDDESTFTLSTPATSTIGTSKENTNTSSTYEKWKKKEADDIKIASLLEQLNDANDQLKQTEEELVKANTKFNRERQLREEADKQVIAAREKGFAYHMDRRSAARSHAEDCLNTERLKLRNADLQEQYEILKLEAKKTLEKARDRVHEEKASREAMEEQMIANRRHFEDIMGRERQEHQMKMQELANQVKEAQTEIMRARTNTAGTEHELDDLRRKYADYQQQVIEAKAESKKEQTLRAELQAEMKAMENELDSMERDLTSTRESLQKAEKQLEKQRKSQEALEKAAGLYEQEHSQRLDREKSMEDLRATAAEAHLTLLEAREKIKVLEEELRMAKDRCNLMEKSHQEELEKKGRSVDEQVGILQKEIKAMEDRCKNLEGKHEKEEGDRKRLQDQIRNLEEERGRLEEKCKKEQQTKEKSEEATFKLTQSMKKLTAELDQAKSKGEEAEKQSSDLRQKVETISSNFENAISQAESTEKKLQEQFAVLSHELEESKVKYFTLQETLKQAEAHLRQERELRLVAEADLTMEERSLARRNREENEQEMINMEANFQALRLSEEKWRNEKQQREDAEEQCRSLREEIYQLKHEQVISSQHVSHRPERTVELENRIIKLKGELDNSESRRQMIKESLNEERRHREEVEQQNKDFRDMIPEYAEAEEKYQQERRLRIEAEATIETLQSKLMGNKWGGSVTQDESTFTSADNNTSVGLRQQVSALQAELASVRSKCEKTQAALDDAHDRYEQEHHERMDIQSQLCVAQERYKSLQSTNKASPSRSSSDVERKLREKAEKQVMSMRLKMEAKETEIATLKSRLSDTRSSSSASGSNGSSRPPRRPPSRPGIDVGERSPSRLTGREVDHRKSVSVQSIKVYDDDTQQSQAMRSHEEQNLREQIMVTLPDYVRNNFGRIGFVKHSAFDYWPALVLDPFTVPLAIRTKWLELYYEFDKRDMFLVYLYGRRHCQDVNAYPIVEPHHFISYEEGVERNLDQLPVLIEDKIRYGDQLTEIEEEVSDGLTQIRIDARKHPSARTHPLAETQTVMVRRRPSMTSSTSNSSNTVTSDEDSPKRSRADYSKNG